MIGLIVEGQSDYEFFRRLCERLRLRTKVRVANGGKIFDEDQVATLCEVLLSDGCRRVVVIVDEHCNDERKQSAYRLREYLREQFGKQVSVFLLRYAFETWVLADPNLVGANITNPENPKYCRPNKVLNHLLRKHRGAPYLKAPNRVRSFADQLDIKLAQQRCSSFRDFKRLLGLHP